MRRNRRSVKKGKATQTETGENQHSKLSNLVIKILLGGVKLNLRRG